LLENALTINDGSDIKEISVLKKSSRDFEIDSIKNPSW